MPGVLALLDRPGTARTVLVTAGLAAARLGATAIDVLHVRPAVDPSFLPTEEVMTTARALRFAAAEDARSAALKQVFTTWGGPGVWREIIGDVPAEIAAEAAKADLTVIAGSSTDAITAALFHAHAAVLLAPETPPASLGQHIAIAWKSNPPAARAVAAAQPLLASADRITVLIGREQGDTADTPPPLNAAGTVTVHPFDPGTRSIGAALIEEAKSAGANLLVMGAWSHSRAYEWVLGGATRDVLSHPDLPVLMRH